MPLDANNNWTSGLVGPAAANPILSIGKSTLIVKSATQVFTGTTLEDVDDMSVELISGESYIVEALFLMTVGGTGGAKISFTSPGGSHALWAELRNAVDAMGFLVTSSETDIAAALPAGDAAFLINGTILNATAGTLQFTGAQDSANDQLSIYVGSYLRVTRIS